MYILVYIYVYVYIYTNIYFTNVKKTYTCACMNVCITPHLRTHEPTCTLHKDTKNKSKKIRTRTCT